MYDAVVVIMTGLYMMSGMSSTEPHTTANYKTGMHTNPCPATVIYLNFHPLEVVSRVRDPQLQVGDICLILDKILRMFV